MDFFECHGCGFIIREQDMFARPEEEQDDCPGCGGLLAPSEDNDGITDVYLVTVDEPEETWI